MWISSIGAVSHGKMFLPSKPCIISMEMGRLRHGSKVDTKMARRTMNSELAAGATDGKYRKNRPNTANPLPSNTEATLGDLAGLSPWWGYSTLEEAPEQYLPDGTKR